MKIEGLSTCPYLRERIWGYQNECNCSNKIYKYYTKLKKSFLNCPYREGYDNEHIYHFKRFDDCKVFVQLNKIRKKILKNDFDEWLKLQQMMIDDENNCIDIFITKIAEDYFNYHYRARQIKRLIQKFKTKMGVALAVECVETDECPYITIAKDIIKP